MSVYGIFKERSHRKEQPSHSVCEGAIICPFTYRRFGGVFAPCFYVSDEIFLIFLSAAIMLLDTF